MQSWTDYVLPTLIVRNKTGIVLISGLLFNAMVLEMDAHNLSRDENSASSIFTLPLLASEGLRQLVPLARQLQELALQLALPWAVYAGHGQLYQLLEACS